jgi:hypothetical protein
MQLRLEGNESADSAQFQQLLNCVDWVEVEEQLWIEVPGNQLESNLSVQARTVGTSVCRTAGKTGESARCFFGLPGDLS